MDNLTIFIAVTAAAVVIQAGNPRRHVSWPCARPVRAPKPWPTKYAVRFCRQWKWRSRCWRICARRSKASSTISVIRAPWRATRWSASTPRMSDLLDRARLQVIRADELVGRALDRVEETGDLVNKTVVSPVRQVSGILQGLTAGLEFFFSGRRRSRDGASCRTKCLSRFVGDCDQRQR